jgi:thiazole tautomerase (transcriptional regulator TenI)
MRHPLQPPVVCLVTDRCRVSSVGETVHLASTAAACGAGLIQIRAPDLEAGPLLDLVRRVRQATASTPAAVVVNERVDVAIAAGADGVHLRADGMDTARVRAITPRGCLIGRSVHSVDEAVAAESSGVDYLIMGTIYPTRRKPGRAAAGPEALAEVCRTVNVPVLAIGGVTVDRLGEVARAGAAGIAAIGLFADTADHEDGYARLSAVMQAITRAFATP